MTATRSLSASLQHIGRTLLADDTAGLSDIELVGRFVERRDDAAFTALVRRYGVVVLGVCRRVLRHEQDAEDAFQATFLVFARKAASVRRTGAVGNWLYGVAYNVARKAKAVRHRREAKERDAAAQRTVVDAGGLADDLRELLDAELHALPDKYRTPIVLCDLMGHTIREAADAVGCPPKTLGTRLGRGRSLLAGRLTRRGVIVPAAALSATLAPCASAAVPVSLIDSTVHTVIGSAAVSPVIAALMQGASNAMLLKSIKSAALVTCGAVAVFVVSVGFITHVVAKPTAERSGRSAGTNDPTGSRSAPQTIPDHVKHFFDHLHKMGRMVHDELGFTAADDKPALSGTWKKKDGELKIEFTGKKTMKLSPHGNDDILIECEYTTEKDGLVKVVITGIEGNNLDVKKKVMMRMPVGTEFSFKWKVQDDAATLAELTGKEIEPFKSILEGDFGKK